MSSFGSREPNVRLPGVRKMRDAIDYVNRIKRQFSNRPEVYQQFKDILGFVRNNQRPDILTIIRQVSLLLYNHPDLLEGFNEFLPEGYIIHPSEHSGTVFVITPAGYTMTIDNDAVSSSSSTITDPDIAALRESMQQNEQVSRQHQQHQQRQPSRDPHPEALRLLRDKLTNHEKCDEALEVMQSYQRNEITIDQLVNKLDEILQIDLYALTRQTDISSTTHETKSNNTEHQYTEPENTTAREHPELAYTEQSQLDLDIGPSISSPTRMSEGTSSYATAVENSPELSIAPFGQDCNDTEQVLGGNIDNESLSNNSRKRTLGDTDLHNDVNCNKRRYLSEEEEEIFLSNHHRDKEFMDECGIVDPIVSFEDAEIFRRICDRIGSKPAYHEMLKIMSLYICGIIDQQVLLDLLKDYIGDDATIIEWLKKKTGYKNKQLSRPSYPMIRKPNLDECPTVKDSPSYRRVPKEWRDQPCSGRDDLCKEVLNDEFASYSTMASEEDTESASLKNNPFEEALHRYEEERYQYDTAIDSLESSIALLESFWNRLTRSKEQRDNEEDEEGKEEKERIPVDNKFGGDTVSIYQRTIKEIYGRQKGAEIIDLMTSHPRQTLPVVIDRLKSKYTEWKKAQREMNTSWREWEAKSYYRSLDFQGISLRGVARSALERSALVDEITQAPERSILFMMHEPEIFNDIARVIFAYIGRQGAYATHDRRKIRKFIQVFVPLLFHTEEISSSEGGSLSEEAEDDETRSIFSEGSTTTTTTIAAFHRSQRDEDEDSVVSSPVSPIARNAEIESPPRHQQHQDVSNTPSPASNKENDRKTPDTTGSDQRNVAELLQVAREATIRGRSEYTMYCNASLYCFLRLYQKLYSTLLRIKNYSKELNEPSGRSCDHALAGNLFLFSERYTDIDISKGHYHAFLQLLSSFFNGLYDQNSFEERVRFLFLREASSLFTFDVFIHAAVRQILAIFMDPKVIDLIRLYRNEYATLPMESFIAADDYEAKARSLILATDHFFKVSVSVPDKIMTTEYLRQLRKEG